jgi:DNA processing protein
MPFLNLVDDARIQGSLLQNVEKSYDEAGGRTAWPASVVKCLIAMPVQNARVATPEVIELDLVDIMRGLNEFERKNAPVKLFAAGDVALLRDTVRVAVVGSRKASLPGRKRTARLVAGLVEKGVVIVSGLAAGIDTAAHEETIRAAGRTIAVIGTPIDEAHPAANASLQAKLMREHLVVSQFPAGHPTLPANFPRRNRTMALLCHASVIVEAGDSSGTLSQGWEALRLNRPLFILKSVFEDNELTWPEEMRRYGAAVLESLDQLFDVLPIGLPRLEEVAF